MKSSAQAQLAVRLLAWLPLLFLVATLLFFSSMSPRFLTSANLTAILVQSSWLIVLALGVNLVLLTAGVDLSIGSIMYFVAVAIGLALPGQPVWFWPLVAIVIGGVLGLGNAVLVTRAQIPPFIATLALAFVVRGAGLWLSSTQMIIADPRVAETARSDMMLLSWPVLLAAISLTLSWLLLRKTAFGLYVRAIGASKDGARRAGIPETRVIATVYVLCGAFAGLAGFISFSQTSAATAAFGLNSEFLAIAAAVLGGTSLFGGRGSVWAPVLGALLIMTVQNGLVLIDANPYAYPVVTGGVILAAALFDSLRASLLARAERRRILPPEEVGDGKGAVAGTLVRDPA